MYNLLDTEFKWDECERFWKSQNQIKYFYNRKNETFVFFKTDGTFSITVPEEEFYRVKKDIYLQNLGDNTELTQIYSIKHGTC